MTRRPTPPLPHHLQVSKVGDRWVVRMVDGGREVASRKTHEEAVLCKVALILGEVPVK